jgi:hypothetical protein
VRENLAINMGFLANQPKIIALKWMCGYIVLSSIR